MKILHIDDNIPFTETFSNLLEIFGFQCSSANDVPTGLTMTIKEDYDAIILDLSMPEQTGFDFIDELEKMNLLEKQKIIVLSGYLPKIEEIDKLLNRGIVACLEKPVSIEKIKEVLSSISKEPIPN